MYFQPTILSSIWRFFFFPFWQEIQYIRFSGVGSLWRKVSDLSQVRKLKTKCQNTFQGFFFCLKRKESGGLCLDLSVLQPLLHFYPQEKQSQTNQTGASLREEIHWGNGSSFYFLLSLRKLVMMVEEAKDNFVYIFYTLATWFVAQIQFSFFCVWLFSRKNVFLEEFFICSPDVVCSLLCTGLSFG